MKKIFFIALILLMSSTASYAGMWASENAEISGSAITDNSVVRGDGGANGIEDSGVLVDDSDNVTGVADFTATGNVAGATYGSDSSISDAELLTIDNGATTEILVGGGAGSAPVWTTATGSGAPARATSPTLDTPIFTRKWISVATDTVLTAEQCKFTYIEVTAAATVTLPASESGLDIIVIQRTGGFQVYIDTNAANYIRNEDTDLDDGDKVGNDGVSSIKGDSYRLFSIPTGASTFDWQGLAIKGPWTDQGA